MTDKLEILSTLYFFHEDRSPVSYQRIRHGRVILSLFKEGLVLEGDYFQYIEELSDEDYLDIKGDLLEDCKIKIKRTGEALVHSLGKRRIGETNFERLKEFIQKYLRSTPSNYMENIGERLKTLQEKREEKIMETNPRSIHSVGLLLETDLKDKDIFVHQFELTQEMMKKSENLDWDVVSLKNELRRKRQNPVVAFRDDDILTIITMNELKEINFRGENLKPQTTQKNNQNNVENWSESLISFLMERWLKKMGYVRARQTRHKFIKLTEYETSTTHAGIIREYDSVDLNYSLLEKDCVFLCINEYTSFMKSALEFLTENDVNLEKDEPMMKFLDDYKLRIIPSFKERDLKKIIPNINIREEKIKGMGRTYEDFWKDKYDFELTQTVQPIFVLEGWGSDLYYPAETVSIDRYSLEKQYGNLKGRSPSHESPEERIANLKNITDELEKIKDNQNLLSDFIEVKFEEICPSSNKLLDLGAFKDIIRISPPLLEFARGEIRLDPIEIFYDDNIGPICGRKNLSISHLVIPRVINRESKKVEIGKEEINKLISSFNKMFNRYGFGTIKKDSDLTLIKYNPDSHIQKLEEQIRELDYLDRSNSLGIAVIPDDSSEHYYSLKRLFPTRTGIPLQELRMSSCFDILKGNFKGANFLSLKLLIKSLKKGETIWTLANSAGFSREDTLFVGIGFSRFPREKKVSKCAAVMHGSRGDKISWKVFPTLQERTITKQWFDNLLYRIQDIVKREKPSRLVFYRKGTLYPIEAEAIKESLKKFGWVEEFKTSFVSIKEGKDYRFSMAENGYDNIPTGYCILLNSDEAILSTSNYDERELHIGTVIPIILKLEIGDDDIIDIVKEYHDLTYLNWQSPMTTPKLPFIVNVAEKLAKLNREGVPLENMFYLDL